MDTFLGLQHCVFGVRNAVARLAFGLGVVTARGEVG
jgi:hypothetical protein